tara:strand:- start:1140 stop:2444 length:1305 start_codon:yes stop_codon:yes gene_type:complete
MKKNVKIKNQEGLKRSLEITVDKENYASIFKSSILDYTRNSNIPGFRKGKAPENIILSKYGKNIHADIIGKLVNRSLDEALTENNLEPASPHQLDIKTEGSPTIDLCFVANFEVYPNFELSNLKNITIEEPDVDIEEVDVMDVIKNIQNQHVKWSETSSSITSGNKVILDYKAAIDDQENKDLSRDNYTLIVDEKIKGDESTVKLLEMFYENLTGKQKNDDLSVDFNMPKSFANKEIAGKKINFKIKIKQIFSGIKPDLNKDFYKLLGLENSNDEEFKKSVSDQMKIELENRKKSNMTASLNERLLENVSFDVPNYLLEGETKIIQDQYKGMMKDLDEVTKSELDKIAIKRVRLNLIYRKIAKSNNITATDQDAISYINQSNDPSKNEIITKMKEDKNIANQIKHKIIEDGIVNYALSVCKIEKIKKKFNEVVT